MFARRTLQRIILEDLQFLSDRQLKIIIGALNRNNEDSLSQEWEVIVLSALSKLGHVRYEKQLGARRPDIHFSGEPPEIEFIADVTTVSDVGYEIENPLDYFREQFYKFLKKNGLSNGGFAFHVNGAMNVKTCTDWKMALRLPPKNNIYHFFKSHLSNFAKSVRKDPERPNSITINTDEIDIAISYNPKERWHTSYSYPSYTVAYSEKRNPVHNILEKKAIQLRESGFQGVRGIILCDGGCQMLSSKRKGPSEYSLIDIINYFLTRNTSVVFVVVITVEQRGTILDSMAVRPIVRIFANEHSMRPVVHGIRDVLLSIESNIPIPETNPKNALHWLKGDTDNTGRSFGDASVQKKDEIKISSRLLSEILAGWKNSKSPFANVEGLPKFMTESAQAIPQYFAKRIAEGRMIEDIQVENNRDKDDDWLVFRFGPPDPAIMPFRAK